MSDWMVSIAICYVCILASGISATGFSAWAFGNALFIMLLGFVGPMIGVLGSWYEPMLIPLFIVLSAIWAGMFYALIRLALRRFLQISIITVFFITLFASGMFGIVSTQVI
ncbi:MAG: hypothetical protein ABI240_09470 [Sphingomonas sp.]